MEAASLTGRPSRRAAAPRRALIDALAELRRLRRWCGLDE
jgi:hypothetical protein